MRDAGLLDILILHIQLLHDVRLDLFGDAGRFSEAWACSGSALSAERANRPITNIVAKSRTRQYGVMRKPSLSPGNLWRMAAIGIQEVKAVPSWIANR